MKGSRWLPLLLAVSALSAGESCAPGGFQSVATIDSVRILASQADPPYAKPGAKVSLSVLAVDGRATKTTPMKIYWLPFLCMNPTDDAYYSCFDQIAAGGSGARGDGGGGGAEAGVGDGGALLEPGVDLTPILTQGESFSFVMPENAVTSHVTAAGTKVPYGIAIVFNIACAGHVELVSTEGNANPQAAPVGCFDENHRALGADDFVIGFTRVYAYDTLTNANPVIDHVDVQGSAASLTAGLTTPRCTSTLRASCPQIPVGPVVLASSWEANPEELDPDGNPTHEEIWTDFFTTFGQMKDDARLLYDSTTGSLGGPSETDTRFLPPDDAGDGKLWMVVHDNRGGATWATLPAHVQ